MATATRTIMRGLCHELAGVVPGDVLAPLAHQACEGKGASPLGVTLDLLRSGVDYSATVIDLIATLDASDEADLAGRGDVHLPRDVQMVLAGSKRVTVLRALAGRDDLHPDVASILARHRDAATNREARNNRALATQDRFDLYATDGQAMGRQWCRTDESFAEEYFTAALFLRGFAQLIGGSRRGLVTPEQLLSHVPERITTERMRHLAGICARQIRIGTAVRDVMRDGYDSAFVRIILDACADHPDPDVADAAAKTVKAKLTVDLHPRGIDKVLVWRDSSTLDVALTNPTTRAAALAHPEIPEADRRAAALGGGDDAAHVAHNTSLSTEEIWALIDTVVPAAHWAMCAAVGHTFETRHEIMTRGPGMVALLCAYATQAAARHNKVKLPDWFDDWLDPDLVVAALEHRDVTCPGSRFTTLAGLALARHPQIAGAVAELLRTTDQLPVLAQRALADRVRPLLDGPGAAGTFTGLFPTWEGTVVSLAEAAALTAGGPRG